MDEEDRLRALQSYGILDTPPERGFDDIVLLARELCAAPIALVSLVDRDRQWFKARLGLEERQTDLDRSVCRFVVQERDTVVIPDLSLDPRTRDNPLVTEEPRVRFYAGAPLVSPDGAVLGALCVLDTEPRSAGLTSAQRQQLEALARHVGDLLDLRRAIEQRDGAMVERANEEAARHLSERRWRELFQQINEGFLIGRVVRDGEGRIVDWRHDQVNRAWGELVGIPPADAVGRTARELFPGFEQEWIDQAAEVVETGATAHFTREIGALGRWYDGLMQPVGDDCFTVLFVEVTDRLETARRMNALLEIGDALRDCVTGQEMTRTAAQIVGRTLAVSRAGYGRVDGHAETVEIEPDWTADGVASIAGRYRFEDFGRIREELARGEPLVIEDVATDPRTADDPGPMRSLGIGALVNMPVLDRGRTTAVFIVHDAGPRAWTGPELAFIRNVADRLEVGLARLSAEQRRLVVNREMSHRLKNSLTMVQAIANQTLRRSADPEALRSFNARLQALGTAHDVLVRRELEGGDLRYTLDNVLDLVGAAGRYSAEGPKVTIGSAAVLSASLLFHELATNAVKYGALSATGGRVDIRWTIEDDELRLVWREVGGPPATPPTRRGFGSTLLRLGLVGTGGSEVSYGSSGLSAVFVAPMDQVV